MHGTPENKSGEHSTGFLSIHSGRVFFLVLLKTDWDEDIQALFLLPAMCSV
jgi:hypothetical protein